MTLLSLLLSIAAAVYLVSRCCGRKTSEPTMTTELTAVVVTMLFTIATSVPIGLYMARVSAGSAHRSMLCSSPSRDWC